MSVREINQRWLATMALSDDQIEMRARLCSHVSMQRAACGPKPSWWRLSARRRWNREVAAAEQRGIEALRAEIDQLCTGRCSQCVGCGPDHAPCALDPGHDEHCRCGR